MSHLGSFGAAVRELNSAERDTFDFFEEKFTVVGTIPPMLMLQLGAATTGKIDEQEGMGAMWEAMRTSLTAPGVEGEPGDGEQFAKFYRLAVSRCCDLDGLMALAMALFESQSGRPTEEPRGSSPGQSSTSPNSSASSSAHPAFAHLTPVNEVLAG